MTCEQTRKEPCSGQPAKFEMGEYALLDVEMA